MNYVTPGVTPGVTDVASGSARPSTSRIALNDRTVLLGDRLCELTRDEVSILVGALAYVFDQGRAFTAEEAEIALATVHDLRTTGRVCLTEHLANREA